VCSISWTLRSIWEGSEGHAERDFVVLLFFFRRSGHGLVLVTGSLHVCLPLPFWTTHQVKHYIRTTIPDYHQPPALPLPAASAASIAITITYLLNSKFQSSQVERRTVPVTEVATAVGTAAAEHCHSEAAPWCSAAGSGHLRIWQQLAFIAGI